MQHQNLSFTDTGSGDCTDKLRGETPFSLSMAVNRQKMTVPSQAKS